MADRRCAARPCALGPSFSSFQLGRLASESERPPPKRRRRFLRRRARKRRSARKAHHEGPASPTISTVPRTASTVPPELERTASTVPPEPEESAGQCCVFNRIACFPSCAQDGDLNCQSGREIENLFIADDLRTILYQDAQVGYVDIIDPFCPAAQGRVTSSLFADTVVAKDGEFALVPLREQLLIVEIASQTVVRTVKTGVRGFTSGNVCPDRTCAVFTSYTFSLLKVNISDTDPAAWTIQIVDLTALGLGEDSATEQLHIRADNVAVMSQKNLNVLALINVTDVTLLANFSAGEVNITGIDTTEDCPRTCPSFEGLPSNGGLELCQPKAETCGFP